MEPFLLSLGVSADVIAALRLDTLMRLCLASLLGGAVGLERELSGKPAGLRTNLLICVGAALITDLSILVAGGPEGGDPGRLAAQIVSGIGFIGAGTILHGRGRVTGLTSAATLWVVAAIGIAVGARAYVEATGAAILVLVTLLVLRRVERVVERRLVRRRYALVLHDAHPDLESFEAAMEAHGVEVRLEHFDREGGVLHVAFGAAGTKEEHRMLMRHLASDPGVRSVARS